MKHARKLKDMEHTISSIENPMFNINLHSGSDRMKEIMSSVREADRRVLVRWF